MAVVVSICNPFSPNLAPQGQLVVSSFPLATICVSNKTELSGKINTETWSRSSTAGRCLLAGIHTEAIAIGRPDKRFEWSFLPMRVIYTLMPKHREPEIIVGSLGEVLTTTDDPTTCC